VTYGAKSWNTDSRKNDTAFLLMRDKQSGKIVQIQLEETEPDSSRFSGQFRVSLVNQETSMPEIFVPPDELRNGEKNYKRIHEMIVSNKLSRKPSIWTKDAKGQTTLDVFDTREQAEAALKAYNEQLRAEKELKKKKLVKPVASESTLAVAKNAERKTQLDNLALEAAKREAERARLSQIETQRAEARAQKERGMSAADRAARIARAKLLSDAGIALSNQGDFVGAEAKFAEAMELDPTNKAHSFKYGISLYRNNKFNEALVAFRQNELTGRDELERKYYMALTHYRLAELDASLRLFTDVAASKDPVMGPASLFYVGVIQFTLEQFDPAKKAFEDVIDTSTDPALDQQAEDYLDKIVAAKAIQKMREKKWTLTGTAGLSYDSNILLSPDSSQDQGTAQDVADVRLLTIGDVEYRPVFSERREWSTKLNMNLTNSLKNEAAKADPFLYNLSAPYVHKGMAFNKGYKLVVRPGYELLYMDPSGTGTKDLTLSSYILGFDNTFVMKKDWFSMYTFEYRMDDSPEATSRGPNDADANKLSLKTIQTMFLDKSRKEALLATGGLVWNMAKGSEKKYKRYELGVMYAHPTSWGSTWTAGLSLYKLIYDDAVQVRSDVNSTFSTGFSKPIKEWVTWGVVGSYIKNDSNLSANEYSKYLIMTTATFTTNL